MARPKIYQKIFDNNGLGSTIKHEAIPAQDQLPSHSGQSGKFLTTDGASASWAEVQSGGINSVSLDQGSANGTIKLIVDGTSQSDVSIKGIAAMAYKSELSAEDIPTHNQTFSTITNTPTTIAGYGITDAYTMSEVDAKVSSVYRYKGSVATYDDLPTTGQVVGDVYNVEDTGANYAWTGTAWDKLSETVDLSGKQDKATAVTHTANAPVGSATQPVYVSSTGVATAISYTIAKSVPANALFTDTVYTHPTTDGNKHVPAGGATGNFLLWSADGTAQWSDAVDFGDLPPPYTTVYDNTGAAHPDEEVTSTMDFRGAYSYNTNVAGEVNFEALTSATMFENAFNGCSGITNVAFPALSIASTSGQGNVPFSYAFAHCSGLKEVSFPVLTTTNAAFAYAFAQCPSLAKATFPVLSSVDGGDFSFAFSECTSLSEISFPALTSVSGSTFNLTFVGCSNLKKVSFSALTSVNEAFAMTFEGCSRLSEISFPVLTTVSSSAFTGTFNNCSLSEALFPSLTTVNNAFTYTFTQCSKLARVSFPVLSSIEGGCFENTFVNCTSLSEVSFPALTAIPSYAMCGTFMGCTGLKSVSFPVLGSLNGGTRMFLNCTNNLKVTFGSSAISFTSGEYGRGGYFASMFMSAGSSVSVEFTGITSILSDEWTMAFADCSALKSVSFPALTTANFLPFVFASCTNLTTALFPSLTFISVADSMFTGCTSLSSISFPALTSIGTGMIATFANCTNLREVSFPALTSVSEYVFGPPGISYLDAFEGCTNLSAIHFLASMSSNADFYNSVMRCCASSKIVWDL